MSVSFAEVTRSWPRCKIPAPDRMRIRNLLAAHGENGCSAPPGLSIVETRVENGVVVHTCLFHKVRLEFECDAIRRHVTVKRVAHASVDERKQIYDDNPALLSGPFVANRDRG